MVRPSPPSFLGPGVEETLKVRTDGLYWVVLVGLTDQSWRGVGPGASDRVEVQRRVYPERKLN